MQEPRKYTPPGQRNGKLWASTCHSLPFPFPHPKGASKMQEARKHAPPGATQWKVVAIHFPLPPLPLPTSQGGLKNAKIHILQHPLPTSPCLCLLPPSSHFSCLLSPTSHSATQWNVVTIHSLHPPPSACFPSAISHVNKFCLLLLLLLSLLLDFPQGSPPSAGNNDNDNNNLRELPALPSSWGCAREGRVGSGGRVAPQEAEFRCRRDPWFKIAVMRVGTLQNWPC